MRAMSLTISSATQVAVALSGRTDGHVQSGRGATTELPVRMPHASVKYENGSAGPRPAALVCTDPVQAPGCSLHVIGLNLGNHVNLSVGLHILGCTAAGAENGIQILLGSTHLDEGDTSGWMSNEIASVPVHLAHAQNLGVAGSGLHHHNPLLLLIGADLTKAGPASIGGVVVEHGHACNELVRRRTLLQRGSGASLANIKECVGVSAPQACQDALRRSAEQLVQNSRALLRRVCREDERGGARDMRASH